MARRRVRRRKNPSTNVLLIAAAAGFGVWYFFIRQNPATTPASATAPGQGTPGAIVIPPIPQGNNSPTPGINPQQPSNPQLLPNNTVVPPFVPGVK